MSEEVLLLAPTGRDAHIANAMLEEAGLQSIICRSGDELLRLMTDDCGPLILTPEALTAGQAGKLERILNKQPVWSDLPIIIFKSSGRYPKKLGEITARRSTTLLPRPISSSSFIYAIRAAVRDRQRQFEIRDLLGKLQLRNRRLQRLTLQLSEAEESERNRLAAVLHDDLQQLLAGAGFRLELIHNRLDDPQIRQMLIDLRSILDQTLEKTRNLSHQLSPPTLNQQGLISALQWLADRLQKLHGLHTEITVSNYIEPSQTPLKLFLFRAAQELLFNIVKHAGSAKPPTAKKLWSLPTGSCPTPFSWMWPCRSWTALKQRAESNPDIRKSGLSDFPCSTIRKPPETCGKPGRIPILSKANPAKS